MILITKVFLGKASSPRVELVTTKRLIVALCSQSPLRLWTILRIRHRNNDASVENITVVVNNGIYQPSRIKIAAGKKTTLQFFRKDGSPCAATVLFPALEISEELPLETNKPVEIPPMLSGEYLFHCPMKMYTGTLIVE